MTILKIAVSLTLVVALSACDLEGAPDGLPRQGAGSAAVIPTLPEEVVRFEPQVLATPEPIPAPSSLRGNPGSRSTTTPDITLVHTEARAGPV